MTAATRYPDLGRLLDVLGTAGFDVDPIDIADACWLATTLRVPPPPPVADEVLPPPSTSEVPASPPSPPAPETTTAAPGDSITDTGARGNLYASARSVTGRGRSIVLLPDAPALLNKLALGRALRPLRRRIASHSRLQVDELATVKRTAARRLAWPGAPLVPAFRPVRARWLDAVLLVDRSQTMAVWRRSIEELAVLLQRLGAFRDVRVWYLGSGPNGPVLEAPGDQPTQWVARDIGELIDPSGRRLVMIASDCIDPAWMAPAMARWLARQARVGPLAILQILPPHLWQRTALAPLPGWTMTASAPGLPTHRLAAAALEPDELDGDSAGQAAAPVIPVVPLRSDALAAWAQLIIGASSGRATGRRFVELPAAVPRARPTVDVPALVGRFLAGSSAVARRLAAYLAAVPLTAPVIRLVRQEVLPEAREEHLVEVLFSGLVVQCVPDLWTVAPGDELYDFRPGVREQLLSGLDTATIEGVARAIGGYLERTRGAAYNFAAAIEAPEDVPGDDAAAPRAFATVSAALLRMVRPHVQRTEPNVGPPPASSVLPIIDQSPVSRENGLWIWVDGTDDEPVLPHHAELARALGAELARAGFSLSTGMSRGDASGALPVFVLALRHQGFPSGISRAANRLTLLHRVALSDGLLLIGAPSALERGVDLMRRSGKLVTQLDAKIGDSEPDQPAPPVDWTPHATFDYAHDVVTWLVRRLGPVDFPDVDAALLHDAALALDETEVARYNERRMQLRAAHPAQAMLDAAVVHQLITDLRRPSHRLVGYEFASDIAQGSLLAALRAEARWVEQHGSTRTLHLALEKLRDISLVTGLTHDELVGTHDLRARAAAVVCSRLHRMLRENPGLERSEQCRQLIESTLRGARLELAEIRHRCASEYEELRRNAAWNDPRIGHELEELVLRVKGLAIAPAMPEAEAWLADGTEGARFVGLALVMAAPDAAAYPLLAATLEASSSPFEELTALRALEAVLPLLDAAHRDRLRTLLRITCARCGKENQGSYLFCIGCGAELSDRHQARRAALLAQLDSTVADGATDEPVPKPLDTGSILPPGTRVRVLGPDGAMQPAVVRRWLQGYYELEVGRSGETIWMRTDDVVAATDTQEVVSLDPRYTFDSFVAGPSNLQALTASQAIASSQTPAYDSLFLHGDEGVGKTHLLHAIGHQQLASRPSARIVYVSSEQFMLEYAEAIRGGGMPQFRRRFRDDVDVLLFDDIQFLAGKDSTQNALLFALDALSRNHKQIVLTADRKPDEISGISAQLRKHFAAGLLASIGPPELEVRLAILGRKAALERIDLSDDVAAYIASSIAFTGRELEIALGRLVVYAARHEKSIDLELARQVLRNKITQTFMLDHLREPSDIPGEPDAAELHRRTTQKFAVDTLETALEDPPPLRPGARVLVTGPNGLLQPATVRQLLEGFCELEVGNSGETLWVPLNAVISELGATGGTFVGPPQASAPRVPPPPDPPWPPLPRPLALGTTDADRLRVEFWRLRLRMRDSRSRAFDVRTAQRMEELDNELATIEIQRDRLKSKLGRAEQQLALGTDAIQVRRALAISDVATETVTSLNDLISSMRIELLAADGEFEQLAQYVPRSSFELIRQSLEDGATHCDEARELLRAQPVPEVDIEVRVLERQVARLKADLRLYQNASNPVAVPRMEDLQNECWLVEIDRDNIQGKLERVQQQITSPVKDRDQVITTLSDLLSSLRIEAMAAEGELEQYASDIPRASFELIRQSLKEAATHCDAARALLRRLRELTE